MINAASFLFFFCHPLASQHYDHAIILSTVNKLFKCDKKQTQNSNL